MKELDQNMPKLYFCAAPASPCLQGVPNGDCTMSRRHHRISAGNCFTELGGTRTIFSFDCCRGGWVEMIWKYNIWICRLGNCRLEHGRVHNTTRQYICGDKDVYLQHRTWQVIFEPQCPQTFFFVHNSRSIYSRCRRPA